ncbi:MAG: nucleotide exchange factor GrpE [SAR202 cluster bacterium]|nr:nucleotide exchange factor GrpE [SAR202 cluster bacterium]
MYSGEGQSPGEPRPDEMEGQAAQGEQDTQLKAQMEEALREKDQFRSIAQRAQADLINYRKRAEEEKSEVMKAGNKRLLLKVLPVADDLERAISMVPSGASAPGWVEGLQLVHRNLMNLLDSEGVKRIDAKGKKFDPWESEAVHYMESPDAQEDTVLEVVRPGYKYNNQVLRAAQVIVAKKPEQQSKPATNQEERS